MPGAAQDPPLSLDKLNNTSYNVEGDGPKTEPAEVRRTWYGKKKKELKDGTGTLKPVRQVKHRKYARIKKILNIGEKLKPLGLESSSNYDNQSQARDQPDEAESAVPKAEHITQDNAHSEAINRNLQAAEETRDLYIHVFEARDLRALDENGKSDPYAKIRVKKAVQKTKVVDQDLSPVWDETFVFSTKHAESCLLSSQPKIFFELWDKDFLSPDEFLGQAHIDLSELEIQVDSIEPLWLPLYGEKHGKEIHGLGEMRVAVWFSRSTAMEDHQTVDKTSGVKLSSLCNPPGIPKKLPIVIHTEGNCLYEEPCIHYLTFHTGQVRSVEQIAGKEGGPGRPAHLSKPSMLGRRGSYRQLHPDEPETSLFSDITKHSESMFLAEMSGATFWQGSDTESEVSDDSSENGEEKEDKLKDDGEDPFDEEEENLENPLQTPNAEADSDAPSSRPMENKRLFFEASFGHQRRRTKIGRLQSRGFSWEQGLPFAATVPMKDKSFKLLLCEVDKEKKRSQLLAIAFIPLSDLVQKSDQSGQGEWFQLHDYNERSGGKPVPFGAVQLRLSGADSDGRRKLYNQPLIEDRSSKPIGKTLSASTSKASEEYEVELKEHKENGHKEAPSEDSPSKFHRRSGGRSVRAVELVRDWCNGFQRRSISLEGTTGFNKRLWQAAILVLIALQLALAVVTTCASALERGWQAATPHLKEYWNFLLKKRQERQEQNEDVQPAYSAHKPSDRPLGLVKFLIGSLDLVNQPQGAYFLVFKCGPHWGQTALLKGEGKLVWDWEVQLPIHDPYTLMVVSLFRDQHRKFTGRLTSSPPKMVGKLRLRINTLSPGLQYESDLPMLADRKEGGAHTATMSLQAKLVYMDELPVLAQYFLAPQPYEIYSMGLSEGNVAKQLDFEYKRLTLQWLRTTEPAIPSGIAKEVIGLERQQFVFSRAKANWTRCALEKERFTWIMRFWERNQEWENPAESVALMCGLVTFSFYPQVILVGLLLWIVAYALLTAPKRPGKPQEMYADPEDDDDEEETEEQGGIGQLRKKYMRLVKVALAVQNYLGDFAEVLERLHSLITWADPRATLIFLFACILAALATVTLTLPVVMSVGLCWTVRPPFLRSPTPPPPAAFFLRLPTRSDQII